MASITSLGVGSGLDLQGLVDGLIASERELRLGRLDVREAQVTEKISAFGLLKSSVSLFSGSLNSLGDISTFQARSASSSDADAFTVSASVNAALGNYSIDVVEAGDIHSLTGSGFVDVTNTAITNPDTAIGGGTLTIQQGGQGSFAVAISSAASSLNDIAAAINSADGNTGVEAAVINADSGPVLVLNASEAGTGNEIKISVDDVDGNDTDTLGLSQLTFDALDLPGSNLTQAVVALDAQITVNGQTVTSTSGRTFSDVVTGVSITALSETTASGTATISKDTQQAVDAVNELVESFNALVESAAELGRGGSEEGGSAGVLVGDSALRSLSTQLRRTLFTSIDDTQPEGVRTLSDLGLEVDRSGKLSLDSGKLNALLDTNFDDVARLLAADGNPIAQNQQFATASFDTVASVVGTGDVTISVGDSSFTLAIAGGVNDSLTQIRDAINAAPDNAGVTASIILVDDGGGGTDAQLILTADEAGADASITVAVDDDDGNDTDAAGLSQLASDNLSQLTASEFSAPEGVVVRLQEIIAGFLGGGGETGIIDSRTQGLNSDIDRIDDERALQELRLESFEARLLRQFGALDLLVSNLQSSGQFLLDQLGSISQISTSRNSGSSS